jgi:signal transduction histidine kinase
MDPLPRAPTDLQRQILANMMLVAIPAQERPADIVLLGGPEYQRLVVGMRLPDGPWLNLTMPMPPPRPWHSSTFLLAFALMTLAAALLTLWAVRRLTRPVATLAAAAAALGRDVNAAPLAETGPTEVATAAAAFNTMAARIRRFVQDRTFMLTAIGHDLRTPITRLKLRAEFMEDEEQRRKMLDDLDELEAMVASTLAFGRDATADEPVSAIDLAELVRTVLDETADSRPEEAPRLAYQGPDHLAARVRPIALKRALTNLVGNAVSYGGGARVSLEPPKPAGTEAIVTLAIDDDGPGIPEQEIERAFLPFHRLEESRNRETGGVGLGLPIARNILRAHGGDVVLTNRAEGGLRATVTLPM